MAKEPTSLNGYELSRMWFDFCFENPDKISPNHSALFFFCIEHCNRLGWKKKFGLPTTMAKEAIGIKSYNTYIKTLSDLVEWGFIVMVEKSKNQYSANIIALSKNNKALDKALDKAIVKHVTKHMTKQCESTRQSIDSINKPLTIEPLTINQEQELDRKSDLPPEDFREEKNEPKSTLYKDFIFEYNEFIKIKTNCPAKIDGVQGGAAKAIIAYLKTASNDKTDEGVLGSWKFILTRWGALESFYQSKLKLSEINSNLINIIGQIKNGAKQGNSEKASKWSNYFAQRTGTGN